MEDSTNLISNSVSVSPCLCTLRTRGQCCPGEAHVAGLRNCLLSPNSVMDCLCLVMSINESKQRG